MLDVIQTMKSQINQPSLTGGGTMLYFYHTNYIFQIATGNAFLYFQFPLKPLVLDLVWFRRMSTCIIQEHTITGRYVKYGGFFASLLYVTLFSQFKIKTYLPI
jgi:hypothetical protein